MAIFHQIENSALKWPFQAMATNELDTIKNTADLDQDGNFYTT